MSNSQVVTYLILLLVIMVANAEQVQNITIYLPMRDKVELKTTLYFYPNVTKAPVSSVLYRTPYNIDAQHNYLITITKITGFVVVAQDFRGRW